MAVNLPLSPNALITKGEGHVSAAVDNETVIMSADTGRFHVVAAAGAFIWNLLDTPRTLEQLILELAASFDVKFAQCRDDVEEFVASLVDRKLVIVSGS